MPDAVELHVRTVIAIGINAAPENIRPSTMLRAGEISDGQMLAIARVLERDLGIAFPRLAYIGWTTVADVVDATERALDQVRKERAA